MTDRELLELAAKAAGLEWHDGSVWLDADADYVPWNPLTDDGDALWLAVKLRISIYFHEDNSVSVSYLTGKGTVRCWTEYFNDDNAEELVRRAITSLAAEIGKEMI
jgi:hypothetical protein